eukprot:COSAG05_NODE_10508_length_561_cov_25.748918_2_plen_95_part_01
MSQLLDELQAEFCIDPNRVYATGFSNGGTFTYAVGSALANRFRAIVPCSGTPMRGYATAPTAAGQSVMDIHGNIDNTCPANSTKASADGWYVCDR